MQLQVSSHLVIARHPPVLPYQYAPHVIASILYHVLISPFFICHCKCSLNMSLQYPLSCYYKSVFHMSLRGADRSDVAIFCQFSTWMCPTMQIGSRSATALVCNLLQVNLLQKHRWLTMHRNDSSATKQPYQEFPTLTYQHVPHVIASILYHVIARSGSKRRGNLLTILHMDVADHANRKQVGHRPCLQPLAS